MGNISIDFVIIVRKVIIKLAWMFMEEIVVLLVVLRHLGVYQNVVDI